MSFDNRDFDRLNAPIPPYGGGGHGQHSYNDRGTISDRFESLMQKLKWIGITILAVKFIVTMYHIWH